jgi:hypothetical protein
VLIDGTDGAIVGQSVDGQIGGLSSELSHKGCDWPFTHWQTQLALAGVAKSNIAMTIAIPEIAFIGTPSKGLPASSDN